MLNQLPIYCESLGGLLSFNGLTSLAYLVAAIAGWRQLRQSSWSRPSLQLFVITLAVVGIGSALFHAAPSKLTLLLDAIPVYVFVAFVFALLTYQISQSYRVVCALVLMVLFFIASTLVFVPRGFLNGSIRHIGFLTLAIIMTTVAFRRLTGQGRYLLASVVLYALAIIFRSVDLWWCTPNSVGTHFLWHILNASASYFAIVALGRYAPRTNNIV